MAACCADDIEDGDWAKETEPKANQPMAAQMAVNAVLFLLTICPACKIVPAQITGRLQPRPLSKAGHLPLHNPYLDISLTSIYRNCPDIDLNQGKR